jgi:hypothetical protein
MAISIIGLFMATFLSSDQRTCATRGLQKDYRTWPIGSKGQLVAA